MAKLVKDFEDYQFTFYWVNDLNERISPNLPTLNHAKEWIVSFKNSQHKGIERRKRKCDRRHVNGTMRNELTSKRSPYSSGRRSTDKPIEIEFDLSSVKITKLKEVV